MRPCATTSGRDRLWQRCVLVLTLGRGQASRRGVCRRIAIRGAREHNLKNIGLEIPRHKLTVITGLSGSGKSSLAFDTIYAEGQRRYVESLSTYARQFLGVMDKPDVDKIEGISPAISIDQRKAGRNPRSTVGTITEIYDYLRLLFARVGHPHCPKCGREITSQTVEQIVDVVQALPVGSRILIMAPLVRDRKGEYQQIFDDLRKQGYVRVRVDKVIHEVSEQFQLDKNKKHNIELVVDRLSIPSRENRVDWEDFRIRLMDSVETCLKTGEGVMVVSLEKSREIVLSEHNACPITQVDKYQPAVVSTAVHPASQFYLSTNMLPV
jgi:excinuclease ABC subunit A